MKILYHHRTLGDGAEGIHVSSLVAAMRDHGHEVRIAAVIGEQTNVPTTVTRVLTPLARLTPRPVYELLELAYSAVGYRTLTRLVDAWRPDLLYERYTLFNMAGVQAARTRGVPLVLEVNAPLAWERAHYERLFFKRLARRCERTVCSRADVVVVVSTPLKEHLVRCGVPSKRIIVMPNGTDPLRFRPNAAARADVRSRCGIEPDAVVAGFTGILRPWHGVDLMLQAVAALRRRGVAIRALVVGDGPSLGALRACARDLDIESAVTFTGRVAHDVVPAYLAAADIGVSPRATFYASPMKIPEYMAAGVPVIAPRMPNIEDLITAGVDGELYTPDNVGELTAALGRLAVDGEYRRRLGAAARASIVGGRTWGHVAAHIIDAASPVTRCA